MPSEFFITIESARYGGITGDSARRGYEDAIVGRSFSMGAHVTHEHATKRISGRHSYLPITFTKFWDQASPLLFQVFVQQDALRRVRFDFIRPDEMERDALFYTVELRDVLIVSLTSEAFIATDTDSPYIETVRLIFEEIEIEHVIGKRTAFDHWSSERQ